MSVPPGWYPDSRGQIRWWDGYRWAEHAQGVAGPSATHSTDPGQPASPQWGPAPQPSTPWQPGQPASPQWGPAPQPSTPWQPEQYRGQGAGATRRSKAPLIIGASVAAALLLVVGVAVLFTGVTGGDGQDQADDTLRGAPAEAEAGDERRNSADSAVGDIWHTAPIGVPSRPEDLIAMSEWLSQDLLLIGAIASEPFEGTRMAWEPLAMGAGPRVSTTDDRALTEKDFWLRYSFILMAGNEDLLDVDDVAEDVLYAAGSLGYEQVAALRDKAGRASDAADLLSIILMNEGGDVVEVLIALGVPGTGSDNTITLNIRLFSRSFPEASLTGESYSTRDALLNRIASDVELLGESVRRFESRPKCSMPPTARSSRVCARLGLGG